MNQNFIIAEDNCLMPTGRRGSSQFRCKVNPVLRLLGYSYDHIKSLDANCSITVFVKFTSNEILKALRNYNHIKIFNDVVIIPTDFLIKAGFKKSKGVRYPYHAPIPVISPTTCFAVAGSTTRARISPAIPMKKVQKTFFTCSFFPNAKITASTSAFIARWSSFGRKRIAGLVVKTPLHKQIIHSFTVI